ncbi:HlyC/CorC family transporter [Bianquea renquensis]|jgi:hypothetical protein ELI_3070|uniref:HlyC/CorC family transporter n=1 Tax=Bianquea renquensis TaxID=2763661 RepID=A0A926DQN0_9FIRM|nr:hemolysin family protein [Bianquea renquensis]MBC8542776.1 HlyC/CorC family transporter [Bianquea renquensis]
MGSDIILIIVLGLLILMSAYFSATETAFSSANRIRLKSMAGAGNKRAALVLKMSDNFDRLLSTILIGNNIVNIVATSLATVLFTRHWGDMGVTLSTVVMTVLVLIFGEISPKSLAKESPEKFAMFSAPILKVIMILLTPLNWLFMKWKKLLSKLFKNKDTQSMTEEELMTIVEEAEEDGGIDEHEGELIRSAIEFNDVSVQDILTHRVDLIAIDDEMSNEEIKEVFLNNGLSRLPVYKDTIDHIIGVLHEKDFMAFLNKGGTDYHSVIQQVLFIPENMKISNLLRSLQKSKTHLAVVVDEFGGTAGIVTMEDILEELVGEIWDEHDEVVETFQKLDEVTTLVNCSADLDDLFEVLDIKQDPDSFDSTTVSGWVMEELDRLPEEGDSFAFEGYQVTVMKVDDRRVAQIKVVKEVQVSPEEE